MLIPSQIIKAINSQCKYIFAESSFHLQPYQANRFRLTGNSMSNAVNWYKNNPSQIKVLKWFDDYWLFIEITFIESQTFISMSVFQGAENDNVKHQLFRAEWDDYNNPEENHPQPHWHITSNIAIEETFKEYSDTFKEEGFISTLKDINAGIVNINKIHFAMNGNWQNDESHIHEINDELKIVKWFQGILQHLRAELEYVK